MTIRWDKRLVFNDQSVAGGLDVAYSRGVETLDPQGRSVAANAMRFDRPYLASGRVEWEDTGLTIGASGTRDIRAVGKASDGTTPIVISFRASDSTYIVHTGSPLAFARDFTAAEMATALGAPAGHTYNSVYFDIHHGFILIAIHRTDGSSNRGVTLAYSTDACANFNFLQVRDLTGTQVTADAITSIGDVPHVTLAGSDTIDNLLRTWSLTKFPVNGLSDRENVRFIVADYQSKAGNPGGGQLMGFEANRNGTGAWTPRNARLLYQKEVADEGGYHFHDGFALTVGAGVNLGDVSQRNAVDLLAFDWATYETASVTATAGWHGNATLNDVGEASPQPVASVPWGADGKSVLSSADETYEMLALSDVSSASEKPFFTRLDWRSSREQSGTIYDGFAPLHLRWSQSATRNVWVGGSIDNSPDWNHFSTDGVNLTRLQLRDTGSVTNGTRVWSDGDHLYVMSDGDIYRASFPSTALFTPLMVEPGGVNVARNDSWAIQNAMGAGNTIAEVYWDGSTYRLVSDDSEVPNLPANPPAPDGYGTIMRLVYGGTSTDGGRLYVTPEDVPDRVDFPTTNLIALSVLPLLGDGVVFESEAQVLTTFITNSNQGIRTWQSHANDRWTRLLYNTTLSAARSAGRGLLNMFSRTNSLPVKADFLVRCEWNTGSTRPTYPIDAETTTATANELAVISGLGIANETWSILIATKSPETAFSFGSTDPICCIRRDGSNYIGIVRNDLDLEARIYNAGSLVGTATIAGMNQYAGAPLTVLVACDGGNTTIYATNDYASGNATIAQTIGGAPVDVRTGNIDNTEVVNVSLLGVLTRDSWMPAGDAQAALREYPSELQKITRYSDAAVRRAIAGHAETLIKELIRHA